MGKVYRGPVVSILDEDYALMRELECYIAAEAAEQASRDRRERAKAARSRRRSR